jgi:hypothetical protein
VIALVYPPTCDPTAPYLAVPMLTGFLRANGVRVVPIDANVEAWDELLSPEALGAVRDRVEARIAELERRASLDHQAQLAYAKLWRARGDAHAAPRGVAEAKAILRDPKRFFEPDAYAGAVETIEAGLRAISAAYAPLDLDFTAYRTPFGLTTHEERAREAERDQNPFHDYVVTRLVPRLRAEGVRVVGLSVCFPGQLQPAYAFGHLIKQHLPEVHLTVGGPGVTQMLIRLTGERLARALGPFDSAVVFEGEHTLLSLVRAIDAGAPLRALTNVVLRDRLAGARYLAAHGMEDLKSLPAPDFDGLPLDRYLSPELVLPYDPTRGCYWGKCTFCHYGLAEVGTAKYRERGVDAMISHLRALSAKYGTRRFYFSQDSVAPKTLLKLAEAIRAEGLELRWATDLKPEKYLTQERANTLREAGAVACALGVESASPRVLKLIDKGAPIEVVSDVIQRLSTAGIAAEAMCFTDFPTETADEALETLSFLDHHADDLGVFIVGEFGLTHGARVAQDPQRFGLRETWEIEGDELGLGLFHEEEQPAKSSDERVEIDAALRRLSSGWLLRSYPWAGAVSTAHTLLYYDRFGPGAFRDLASRPQAAVLGGARAQEAEAKFDLERAARAAERDSRIWSALVYEERRVSREAYAAHAASAPALRPAPRTYTFAPGEDPRPRGRRPSHARNRAELQRRP